MIVAGVFQLGLGDWGPWKWCRRLLAWEEELVGKC